jgi:nitrate/nitrite-specific signal transduction histidine kinase
MGLLHALQGMAKTFSDRNGVALEIRNSAQNLNLTDEQEVQVFHIVQEALAISRSTRWQGMPLWQSKSRPSGLSS